MTETKTLFVEAMRAVFSETFPIEKFRGIYVSMEFPEDKANYPGIWVDFDPTSAMQQAGIGHTEYTPVGTEGQVRKGSVWRFAGQASFTIAAMTSLERDTLVDEVVRVLAFGSEDPSLSVFRSMVEINDLMKISMQWDTFALSGKSEQPGTPWGTDEIVYEMTIQIDCQGQFVSDSQTGALLVPLSQVRITDTGPDDEAPTFAPDPTVPIAGVDPRNAEWQ